MAVAAIALTSCETKSNVADVCKDMVKASMHNSARSLVQLNGQKLTISEYEFPGDVNDNRLVYRSIAFGNGVFESKKVDTLNYEYGEWGEKNTSFSLIVTPRSGEPYTLWYSGNAFLTPDGRKIGGEGTNNTARVEKWEKVIASLPNTDWIGEFAGEYVVDSVLEDSIRDLFIPPMTFIQDTIKVFKGKMDTLNADTTCYVEFHINRDASSLANTGHFYKKSIRSEYDRKSQTVKIISEVEKDYDCTWYFSDVTSDSKFVITLESLKPGVEGDKLSISKYKVDDTGKGFEFLEAGMTFTRPMLP